VSRRRRRPRRRLGVADPRPSPARPPRRACVHWFEPEQIRTFAELRVPYTPEHGSALNLPLWQWTEHMYDGSLPDNFVWAAQWLRCWLIKVQNTGEWRTNVPGGPDALTDADALAEVLNVAGRRSGLFWDVDNGSAELALAGFDPEVVKRLFEATLSGSVTLFGSMQPAGFHASLGDLPAPTYCRRKRANNALFVATDSESDDESSVLAMADGPVPGPPPAPAISPGHDPNSPSWSPNSPSYAQHPPAGPSDSHYSPPSPPSPASP